MYHPANKFQTYEARTGGLIYKVTCRYRVKIKTKHTRQSMEIQTLIKDFRLRFEKRWIVR